MPSRHRLAFEKDSDKHVVVTYDEQGDYLRIYQRPAWDHFLEHTIKPEKYKWRQREWLGNAVEVKLDATFRVLVSPELRQGVGLAREAKLIGADDHLELWDKAKHDAMRARAKAKAAAEAEAEAGAATTAVPPGTAAAAVPQGTAA